MQTSVTERSYRGQLASYALTIFLSSVGLMALEIAAARLLAPYIGVSLYSWTAIIGVILGGLSLGNWLGGVWADRGGKETAVGVALGLGALACVAILLLTLVAPLLQESEIGLLGASFIYVLSLFFIPTVLLGVVTPLLTTLALSLDTRTGHIVGMMHAHAAFVSIAGTFTTGYVFIQYFGTQAVVLGTAVLLAMLATIFYGVTCAVWPGNPMRMTYVIAAGERLVTGERLASRTGLDREWIEVTDYLAGDGTSLELLPMLTDDLAPVDRLLSSLIFGQLGR